MFPNGDSDPVYNIRLRLPLFMGIRAGHVSGIGMGFSQMVIFLALALCFWAGAKLVDAGEISFEEMMNVRVSRHLKWAHSIIFF